MTLIPFILIPLLFVLSLRRLWQIPRRLRGGELQLVSWSRPVLRLASLLAYGLLLLATLGVLLVGVELLWQPGWLGWPSWLLWLALLAYPLLYLASAWIFFYGLRRPPPTGSGRL